MAKKTPIINILTYKLDYELSNQIYNEFQSRYKDAKYLINTYKTYQILKTNIKTVETLLALSIFHKRVISNLDAAVKFHGTVSRMSESDTIRIGAYTLNINERNKLLGITMNYNALIKKFSISPTLMDYTETRDFLKKLISLKIYLQNVKNNYKYKGNSSNDTEIPF